MGNNIKEEISKKMQLKVQDVIHEHLKEFRESGLSFNQFCRAHEELAVCVLTRLLLCAPEKNRHKISSAIIVNTLEATRRADISKKIDTVEVGEIKTNYTQNKKGGNHKIISELSTKMRDEISGIIDRYSNQILNSDFTDQDFGEMMIDTSVFVIGFLMSLSNSNVDDLCANIIKLAKESIEK